MIDYLNKKTINLVNMNDENLIKMGLEPLQITLFPRYINLQGNIFYSEDIKLQHYECDLANDIIRILKIMNSNTYDRFEDDRYKYDKHSVSYVIQNNHLFFNDSRALYVYKNNLDIKKEINKKYNLEETFYEPTREEILNDYAFNYLIMKKTNGQNVDSKYFNVNLTPQEHFEIVYLQRLAELKPYTKAEELTWFDMRNWLNYNANIFMKHKLPSETTGVYNGEAMELINTMLETKRAIYDCFYKLFKNSNDSKKLVKDLMINCGEYHPFILEEYKNEDEDSFMHLPNDDHYYEPKYWSEMFRKATPALLTQLVGLDKIETQLRKAITTTKPNIYEEFFNPILLGYKIFQLPKLIFDEDIQQLRWIYPHDFITTGINRECENELKLIKKYVPKDQWYKFLRK